MADDLAKEEPQATAAPAAEEEIDTKKPKVRKKKARRNVSHGQIHVLATFNNTIISVTDNKGNVLTTASAGSSGFRGSKKGTAYAAQIAAEKAITNAKQSYGVSKVDVIVKGVGMGREAAIRTLAGQNVSIDSIKDITTIPHGGVRPRRPKRN
ncbi:30S ribosomal protein S11 [Candidatus Saccharibacteria bacterium]|nr:30S ribosomal protein S11 [Candidatus Saccharibacteria bacterium]MBI2285305.1 30S ribosomal protein S11 [Candidatus Saccharibacteria bacterium]